MRAETRDREMAVRYVYLCDTNGKLTSSRESYTEFISHFGCELDSDFCQKLCLGTLKNLVEIDKIIESCAENWKISRMAIVDRSLLRVGTFELVGLPTPFKVVIDESVELAKRYGGGGSKAFVNGVLNSIAHGISKQKWDVI